MTTVINNPGNDSSGGGTGLIVGVIIAIVLIALFFMYGLPALRGSNNNDGVDIKVELPNELPKVNSVESQ
jgi:hypothetical protein